jgi:1,2-diacylglycerol-3-alpha-glucose alpha-1,2-glucosyltransferase
MKSGGIKTAYEHKKQAFNLYDIDYCHHPFHKHFDIIQLECPSLQSAFYALWARKIKKKVVMSAHVTVEDFKETYTFGNKTIHILRRYLKWYYSLADLLIAPSEYTKKLLQEYGIKRPIEVVSNGLHPSFLENNTNNLKKYNQQPLIGSVGYVTKRKGIKTFCDTAKAFPKCQFKWAGAIHKKLLFDVRFIEKPNNVELLGYVPDIQKTYSLFDVFLFPSYEENQGIVLLEAASFGLPMIIRDLPVYDGWLIHEENCMKCTNEREFIEHLKTVLNDKKLRERIGKNARILAENNDLTGIGKRLMSCYEKLQTI